MSPAPAARGASGNPSMPSPTSTLTPTPKALPDLPFEVIRRIIHHRLALPDSVPEAIPVAGAGGDADADANFQFHSEVYADSDADTSCTGPHAPGSGHSLGPGSASARTSAGSRTRRRTHRDPGSGPKIAWDELAGHSGRQAVAARQKERREVMRDASGMMLVCKAWKPIVMKYLYRSPPLTAASLLLLTESVLRGDKKWDDTRLHPHSIPGRYVRTLDLSGISLSMTDFGDDFDDDQDPSSSQSWSRRESASGGGGGGGGSGSGKAGSGRTKGPSPHVTALSKACATLMPRLPNVTHVKLPATGGGPAYDAILQTVRYAPFLAKLRALEGVQVPTSPLEVPIRWHLAGHLDAAPGVNEDHFYMHWAQGKGLLDMLSEMKRVEYLSLAGQGLGADVWSNLTRSYSFSDPLARIERGGNMIYRLVMPSLDLPRLHTLQLDSLPGSPMLAILASPWSSLPSLSRLLITSYTPVAHATPAPADRLGEAVPDLTLDLLTTHGSKLASLTLLPTREWPPVHLLPPDEVFERYCPDLRHVSLLLPHAAYTADKEGAARLGRVIGRKGSKVERVTLAKWAQRSGGSPSPSPHVTTAGLPGMGPVLGAALADIGLQQGGGAHAAAHAGSVRNGVGNGNNRKLAPLPRTHPFLSALITTSAQNVSSTSTAGFHINGAAINPHAFANNTFTRPDSHDPARALSSVTIDGLTSVSPHLSFAARDAGANGEMRAWAVGMAQRGVQMLDGAGEPVLPVSEHHPSAMTGIAESAGSLAKVVTSGSPGQGSASYGTYGSGVGSWGDMSPLAAALAAGFHTMATGARRSSAGEWDDRGRRRSRGSAMGLGRGAFAVYAAARTDRGADDDDGG